MPPQISNVQDVLRTVHKHLLHHSHDCKYAVILSVNITLKHPCIVVVLLMDSATHFGSTADKRPVVQCVMPPNGHLEK